jgi:hypothetical protein
MSHLRGLGACGGVAQGWQMRVCGMEPKDLCVGKNGKLWILSEVGHDLE